MSKRNSDDSHKSDSSKSDSSHQSSSAHNHSHHHHHHHHNCSGKSKSKRKGRMCSGKHKNKNESSNNDISTKDFSSSVTTTRPSVRTGSACTKHYCCDNSSKAANNAAAAAVENHTKLSSSCDGKGNSSCGDNSSLPYILAPKRSGANSAAKGHLAELPNER